MTSSQPLGWDMLRHFKVSVGMPKRGPRSLYITSYAVFFQGFIRIDYLLYIYIAQPKPLGMIKKHVFNLSLSSGSYDWHWTVTVWSCTNPDLAHTRPPNPLSFVAVQETCGFFMNRKLQVFKPLVLPKMDVMTSYSPQTSGAFSII